MVYISIAGHRNFSCAAGCTVGNVEKRILDQVGLSHGVMMKDSVVMASHDTIQADGDYQFVWFADQPGRDLLKSVAMIKHHFFQSEYRAALETGLTDLPFETVGLTVAAASPIVYSYFCHYVPWRHQKWPYTAGQWLWRDRLGSKIKDPIFRRTILIGAVALWSTDQIFDYMRKKTYKKY